MVYLPLRFSGSAKVKKDKRNPSSGPIVLAADAMPVLKEWFSPVQVQPLRSCFSTCVLIFSQN